MNKQTANQMASIITRLTFTRTLLEGVNSEIDELKMEVRKQVTKKRWSQLERLTSDFFQMYTEIGHICVEIPEIFISLEHLNSQSSDYPEILSQALIQLSKMIENED